MIRFSTSLAISPNVILPAQIVHCRMAMKSSTLPDDDAPLMCDDDSTKTYNSSSNSLLAVFLISPRKRISEVSRDLPACINGQKNHRKATTVYK